MKPRNSVTRSQKRRKINNKTFFCKLDYRIPKGTQSENGKK